MNEISTWEELLATEDGTEYLWTGGDLDFNEIQPTGFTSPVTINGSVDFNGAAFKNFRSMASYAVFSSVNTNVFKQYLKNLTLQSAEHICSAGNGLFFNTLCDWFENIVVTGSIICDSSVSRYSLIKVYAGINTHARQRVDRFGCDLTVRASCPFYMSNHSNSSDPSSSGANTIPFYDSRIRLDLSHAGNNPFFHKMYNSKISGKIHSTSSDATLPIEAYCSAFELEADRTIALTGSTNVVRSDMAEYAENSSPIVRCDSPFSEHKADIAASGFPYNGE